MEHFILYKVNRNFKVLLQENFISVLQVFINRNDFDDFYFKQLGYIIDDIDQDYLSLQLIDEFKDRKHFFSPNDKEFILKNNYGDYFEKIVILKNSINVYTNKKTSLFLEYLSLNFNDLVICKKQGLDLTPIRLVNLCEIM